MANSTQVDARRDYVFWDKWNSQYYDFKQEPKKKNRARSIMLDIWKLALVVPYTHSLPITSKFLSWDFIKVAWNYWSFLIFFFLNEAQWHLVKQSKISDVDCLFNSLDYFSTGFKKIDL